MCNECGKNKVTKEEHEATARRLSPQNRRRMSIEAPAPVKVPSEVGGPCRYCGRRHQPEELAPYAEPFPQIPQFPREGIYGMHPLPTTCKRDIMDHMLRFQRELVAQAEKAKMRVKMMEYKAATEGARDSQDPEERVVQQLDQLDADIQQLKHELMIESLRRKYGTHADWCPCREN